MYSRKIDDRVLTISASGWTYLTTFLLYDIFSGSLWFRFSAEGPLRCIGGEYADRELEWIRFKRISWSNWLSNNPETKFLDY